MLAGPGPGIETETESTVAADVDVLFRMSCGKLIR